MGLFGRLYSTWCTQHRSAGHLMSGALLPITIDCFGRCCHDMIPYSHSVSNREEHRILEQPTSCGESEGQTDHYIFRVFSEFKTMFCTLSTVFSVQYMINMFNLYILYMGNLMLGMLLLVEGGGHLMFIIPLLITMYSTSAGSDRDVIMGVPSYSASGGPIIISLRCSQRRRPRFVCYLLSLF